MSVSTSRRDDAGEALRSRLLDAALAEFAAHGFEGASTRRIAARAQAHQPQINYHFDSKQALWKAGVERLLSELDDTVGPLPDDPRPAFEAVIRGLVRFAASRPELNRIMVHEGTNPSDRLDWLVTTHLRPRATALRAAWRSLCDTGVAGPIPDDLVYHLLIGAASLLHANAPEARLLLDIEPSDDEIVEAHADALVAMFLPTHPEKD